MKEEDRSNRNVGRESFLSIVIPCYKEEQVLIETHKRLSQALAKLQDYDYELVYIDDGSPDQTLAILRKIQQNDLKVRVVSFSRNFGHQVAVTAGLEHSKGDAVVVIDADLQDPPEIIPEMLALWRNGADVVYGVRTDREGESRFKRFTAKMFYRIINRLSDTPIPIDTGDFRLMDRRAVEALLSMPERDRCIRGMVAWVGFRQESVKYRRASRFAGTTKYPLRKMIRFATDGILSFSLVPLKIATWMGLVVATLSLLGIIYALVVRLMTKMWVAGWAFLIIAILFLGGIQLVFLGVMGEYLGRVYGEVKRRPLYFVKERIGFSDTAMSNKGVRT
jgi:dolichol-phosphate mannosyltransferase